MSVVAVRSLDMQSAFAGGDNLKPHEIYDETKETNPSKHDISTKPDIVNPGSHDVLLGRGGGTNNHSGNKNFRDLVNRHKMRYFSSNKIDKPKVAREVVDLWKKLDPPGRFLQRKDDNAKGPGSVQDDAIIWVEVDDHEARKKASQCLREKTAEVKPLLTQLRQYQDQMTEQGVSRVKEQMKLTNLKPSATPDLMGSTSSDSPAPQGDKSLANMPDQPTSFNLSSLRRGSMPPALGHSISNGFPNRASMGAGNLRLHDRRISMPAANRMQSAPDVDMERLMARQQQVLRDAYTVIERSGDIEAAHQAGMQIMQQQQLMAQRQAMAQQHHMEMRANMLQKARNEQMMQNTMAMMHQRNHGMTGMSHNNMNGQEQSLAQRQMLLAQQHQRLVAEQERLVRQEQMLVRRQAEMARQHQIVDQQEMAAQFRQQALPVTTLSGGSNPGEDDFADTDGEFEPLPLNEDYEIPLAAIPDAQPSAGGSPFTSNERGRRGQVGTFKTKRGGLNLPSDDSKPSASENSNKKQGTDDDVEGDDQESEDPKATLLDYRRTLESYITNNQNSAQSLDIDNEGGDHNSGMVNGVVTSDWIEKQLMNDSTGGLSFSTKERRSLHRSNSKKSIMSLDRSTDQLSFAFSDMEHSEEFSKGESRRNATRSMSIVSTGTAMSELTDFDELDCL